MILVNCCFFISSNIIFAIVVGLSIIPVALWHPFLDDLHGGTFFEGETISHLYFITFFIAGSVTMVTAILAACGAHKKNVVALITVSGCLLLLLLLCTFATSLLLIGRPKLSLTEEKCRAFLPLDQAADNIKSQVEALQTSLHCCGLFSYQDWEDNIPKSCECNQEEEMEGKCQTVSYRNFLLNLFWQKKSVFRQDCFPLIMDSVTRQFDIILGMFSALSVLVLLDLGLSALMSYQMFNVPTVQFVPLLLIN
ncbi:CD151 antigen [Dicentrarchus labrax]|uniref:CD151 antigen n=1 Tax=Dicentrarchus labrax TaxID=13489 RepID=UPI0021F51C28|nr:CD151 antigen [Dicentrarchus labrax]